jgi:hydrogenase-4 component E
MSAPWLDTLIVLVVFSNLKLLGSSRLGSSIRTVAVQGILLGLLPLLAHGDELDGRLVLIMAAGVGLKGVVFPWLLLRTLRAARVRREVEPFVGYTASLMLGVLMLGVALWIGTRLPVPGQVVSPLLVPVALATLFVGLFLIVSRKKAISQVLGYLVFENGIYAFGVGAAYEAPLLVELGVLLDVFVAVFVMGIAIFHINREFDSIDTTGLESLKD